MCTGRVFDAGVAERDLVTSHSLLTTDLEETLNLAAVLLIITVWIAYNEHAHEHALPGPCILSARIRRLQREQLVGLFKRLAGLLLWFEGFGRVLVVYST